MATTCPQCGFGYLADIPENVEEHNAYHDEHVNGPVTDLINGTHWVTPASPPNARKAAGDAARIGRRDTHYDFALYAQEERPSESSPIVALSVREGRAVAIVVTRERDCEYRAFLDDLDPASEVPARSPVKVASHRRRSIEFIWVLAKDRRKGVLTGLLRDLELHLGQPLSELAHATPFTEAAVKFWRNRGLQDFFIT